MTTDQPRFDSSRALAAPMPEEAPVMIATLLMGFTEYHAPGGRDRRTKKPQIQVTAANTKRSSRVGVPRTIGSMARRMMSKLDVIDAIDATDAIDRWNPTARWGASAMRVAVTSSAILGGAQQQGTDLALVDGAIPRP